MTITTACRFNNAGIAGEGSREGYESIDKKDPEAISAQLWKSETSEWDAVSKRFSLRVVLTGS
jgi:hypothetical protein